MIDKSTKFMIVGLGLIGGSYARALKKQGYHVEATDTRRESIEYAENNGIIDKGYTELSPEAISGADIIVFALYPKKLLDEIPKYAPYFKKGAIITDVTGVKSCVVYNVQSAIPDNAEFISAHPMAGREVYGVENSDEKIFVGANFIVVPTKKNTERAIEECKQLGKTLGFARISVLSPEEHDEMVGFVSQLTHCIAVSLMTCSDNTHLCDYTGDSFRDLTRIARINEDMWSELFLMNKDALLHQMDTFAAEFSTLRDLLAKSNAEGLKEKMRVSTERRAWFDKK